MIYTIIKKEFLSRVFTFQFTFGIIISIFLISISALVLTKNYQEKLRNYQQSMVEHASELKQIKVYSALNPKLDLPPQPLSIFNEGVIGQFGNQVTIKRSEIPQLTPGSDVDNEFLTIFSSLDFTTIIKIVMSLLAMLFAYDCITRDKESGTLKQMLSNPIPRYQLLLGKYFGGIAVLMAALILSLLLGIVVWILLTQVTFNGQVIVRVMAFMGDSIIYVSSFFLIGVVISALTNRSATALIFSLFVWLVLVFLYPEISSYMVRQFYPIESPKEAEAKLEELIKNYHKFTNETELSLYQQYQPPGMHSFRNKQIFYSAGIVNFDNQSEGITISQVYYGNRISDEQFAKLIQFFKERSEIIEPEAIRTAEQKDQILQQRLIQLEEQRRIIDWCSLLSPAYLFDQITAMGMGTDLNYINRFIDAARQYRRTLIQYLFDKRAFSSPQFVYPDAQFSLADMPLFGFKNFENFSVTFGRQIKYVGLLIFYNIVLFALAFFFFLSYDPR